MTTTKKVNLLWTGGWDSTYRLLEVLLLEKKRAQPYYVIDPDRSSYKIEMETMNNIRTLIAKDWPEAGERLLPTIVFHRDDIKENAEISSHFRRIAARERIGIQYEWLARMAAQLGIDDLELSIENPLPQTFVGRNIRPYLDRENISDAKSYRLLHPPHNPDVVLFKCFRWPIIEITKLDMQALAIQYGFIHVMNKTWFCHKPSAARKPCGVCMPCNIAILEGMSHRVPRLSRLHHYYEFSIRRPMRDSIKATALFRSLMA